MGVNANGLRFLLYAQSQGVDFSRTAMIGRQTLNLKFDRFDEIIRGEFRQPAEREALKKIHDRRYAEGLLEYLGAETVDSFDFSDYQQATHIHDFNRPIDARHHGRYSVVLEGGTIEHVFNFPVAVKNCMEMVKVGGHYLGSTPTNNYMGHGFYQLSPELYFRVFSEPNGFKIRHVLFHEGRESRKWFEIPDPESIGRRVRIINSQPTLLLVMASRVKDVPILAETPQQSDYVSTWEKQKTDAAGGPAARKGLQLHRIIPRRLRKAWARAVRGNVDPALKRFDPTSGGG